MDVFAVVERAEKGEPLTPKELRALGRYVRKIEEALADREDGVGLGMDICWRVGLEVVDQDGTVSHVAQGTIEP